MFPAYPSIQAPKEGMQYYGKVAVENLRKFTTKDEADRTFGIYDKDSKFYIGDSEVVINDNNINVGGEEYEGTPDLWELIVSKDPSNITYTDEDYKNYAKLMVRTNALHVDNNQKKKSRANKGNKWKQLLSGIWKNKNKYKGSGVIVIPSDPNALLERLDLLLASQKAGHTGLETS